MNQINDKELFAELDVAFEQSDIKQLAEKQNCKWNYSLTTTPLYENSLVLIGFNYGAAKNISYNKQTTLPADNFPTKDLGSFSRVIPYLKIYYPNQSMAEIVQTNYCFFRSSKENEISSKDKMLCETIFLKLLSQIKPQKVISFSTSLRQHLLNQKKLFSVTLESKIKSNKGMITATVGELKINSSIVPIGLLPHPNYPIIKSARESAWSFVTEILSRYE